jgi:hemoglobin
MMMTEQELSDLVHEFYGKVREDEVLGPVYKGNPMMAHLKHRAGIEPSMFERWLGLWRETAAEILSENGAAAVVGKAERIAESLQLGMFFRLEPRGAAAAA